ncbi:MAG: AAA family ATPase [Acidaminococcaceae bacterium]|nr:AAA family ATPase [Acidaminococcaceae bacterium]
MLYLKEFSFPSVRTEEGFLNEIKRTCYNTYYPFRVLSDKELDTLDFQPVTIFYGGNGSGKTTMLNIIAETIGAERDTLYNRSSFFEDYLELCDHKTGLIKPKHIRCITSDDVFDFMLNIRSLNEGLDTNRQVLFQEYLDRKYSQFRLQSLDDYDQMKKVMEARRTTQSQFVRENMMNNVPEHSNGESAFIYFTEKIQDNGLYFLDEPENSLSPERQLELVEFLENSVRFFGCQIIMATHSPFLLSMKEAKIYDLDELPVTTKKWTDLPNVRTYYGFFKKHNTEFSRKDEDGDVKTIYRS